MINNNSSIIEFPSLEHPDAWDEPIYLDDMETPDISAWVLPGVFGEYAHALSAAIETPEALAVMTILGVISTIVAKTVYVSPVEGWQEPVNIYSLIALPPANNKSLVMKNCLRPLIEWEQEQATLLDVAIKRQRSERKSEEKIIESLRLRLAKLKNSEEQKQLIQEIADKEAQLIDPPILPKLFINDATPESLIISAYEQGGRLALFSDEGGILETLAGLYSHGAANVDILLKGIDGGEMRVRRKDRSIYLKPYLTVVLTVQPTVICNLGNKRAYTGNGMLERFLYVLPQSKLGYRTHDKPAVPLTLQAAYNTKVKQMLNEYPHHSRQPRLLSLAPQAYRLWRAFQADIERQLRPDGQLAPCQGWGGKICGYTLRIAGLLHVAQSESHDVVIHEDTLSIARDMAEIFIQHAIAAYGLMGGYQMLDDAKEVFKWIKRQGKLSFTKSELILAMRNKKLGKAERLLKAINMLVDRNLISPPQKIPTRKPKTIYHVHPSAFSKINE